MTRFDPRYAHVRYATEGRRYLENLLSKYPNDPQLLLEYFEFLREVSRRSFGLMTANIPPYKFPIYFRANTSDVLNMKQIFANREYGFDIGFAPRYILDLGGYCGYSSIFLAQRFPEAHIIAIEPSIQNFELLTANTLGYTNIQRVHGAVWSQSSRLRLDARLGGHWGAIFKEDDQEGTVRAYSVDEILKLAGWDKADFIKCDIEGAEIEVFASPSATNWLDKVRLITVETHDRFRPESTATVVNALRNRFSQRRSGEFQVFERKADSAGNGTVSEPKEASHLIWRCSGFRGMEIANVNAAPWGIMLVDEETLQLHPNPPSGPDAQAIFQISFMNYVRFETECTLPADARGQVVFGIGIYESGNAIIKEDLCLAPGDRKAWAVDTSHCNGPLVLKLTTRMAPNASSEGLAWARWFRPRFVMSEPN
jgi:FkbM family methyltransferase